MLISSSSPRMLIVQDFVWFISYADCTGLHLVRLVCWLHRTSFGSPRMLIAQDLILVSPRMLIAQGFIWFTSYADCTGLHLVRLLCSSHRTSFGSPRMLIASDFIWFVSAWTYTSDARLVEIRSSLKISIHLNLPFFPPKVFLKLLSGAKPLFHSAFLF